MILDETLLNIEVNTKNANVLKELVLTRLKEDGVISNESALEYAEKWQVIIINNSWFPRWLEKFSRKKESYSYKFVKFEE